MGVFVIPWAQTFTDLEPDAPWAMIARGVPWRWTGDALRLDGPGDVLPLGGAGTEHEMRQRAAAMVARLTGSAGAAPVSEVAPAPLCDEGFELTDGHAVYCATLLRERRLVAFSGALPPADTDLWIVRVHRPARPSRAAAAPGASVICFTPGTRIATPWGPRAIEGLRPGNRILTLDDGAQEILWMGHTDLSGADLAARPDLRPIRLLPGALGARNAVEDAAPDAPLVVSPAHRLLLAGSAARVLFNTPEVLVSARDLLNDRSVTRVHGLRGVRYVHLLLARHQLIWANGVAAESFDPAVADLTRLMSDQRALLRLACEKLPGGLNSYGDPARRCLGAGEAAILLHEAGAAGRGVHLRGH